MKFSSLPTTVILIRHGRSTFNEKGIYQGSSNLSVLTEKGHETAYQVGEFLKYEPIDMIYTSPLKRVQQTAGAMLSGMGHTSHLQQVKQHAALQEIDMHAWEGQTFQRVKESFATDYAIWKTRPHEFQMELAPLKIRHSSHSQTAVETILPAQLSQGHCFPVLDLFARAQTFWQEILPKHQGQTIAIVSHGGTNRALISTALGIPPEQFHQMQQSNCGISRLEFPTGQLQSGRLTLLNRTSPTEEALPKLKEGKQGLRLLLLPSESDSSRNSQVQAIATRLQSIEIDFCLTCASDQPQAIAQQILQYHPRTMQIQSQRLHALTTWQRNIALNDQHPTQLMTSLVIAPMLEIQKMLSEALNIPPNQMHRIPLKPETLTILHYPNSHHLPVLQSINLH